MRRYYIIVALAIILAVLSVVHFIVYEGIVLGFLIQNVVATTWLRALFVFLDISFVVAAILTFNFNNLFTRIFYRCAASWLGFLLYFFFAAMVVILSGAVWGPSFILSLCLFAAAAVIGIYGLIHANRIKIKTISIPVKNVPQAWRKRKILFLSDLHLGQVRGEHFAEKICRRIAEIQPDLVLIGGDMYDGVKVDENQVVQPFSKISPPLGMYFVPGNHEEFSDNTHFLSALRGVGIKVLLDEVVEIDELQIVGTDFKTTNSGEKFKKVLEKLALNVGVSTILLKHVPLHLDIAEDFGIDIGLFGHTHKAQVFPFSLLTPALFKGYDYGLKKYKNMQIYTSSGIGTWGPPLRVGTDSEMVVITLKS